MIVTAPAPSWPALATQQGFPHCRMGLAGQLLQRAVDNLLSNAVGYTPPGDNVDPAPTRRGDGVAAGSGISPDAASRPDKRRPGVAPIERANH